MRNLGLIFLLLGSAASATTADLPSTQRGVAGFLQCARQEKLALVTAHRGGVAGGLAENSLEAAQHTIAHIPALLEVDVQKTKDGVFVLMHDEKIDRTSTGTGNIKEMTWPQLKDLHLLNHAGLETPSRIPTLDEMLNWAKGRAIVQLDVKRGVPVEEVARKVIEADAQHYATIIVYNVEDALRVASVSRDIVMNVNIFTPEEMAKLEAGGVKADHVIAFTGNKGTPLALWSALEKKDVHIGFGTIWDEDLRIATEGDDKQYQKLAALGVDLLVTDRHFEAFRAVEQPSMRKKIEKCAIRSGAFDPDKAGAE